MTGTGPYEQAAMTYLRRGWAPLPLPARSKKSPPTGWTGYDAPYPSGADVSEWSLNGEASHNLALRMPPVVLGIDVDAYGSKPGAETLREAEARLGPLPATWVSTSRDGLSGIRLYQVPAGRVWADVVGPGVEVIHYGHRYIVAAPSIHPDTGAVYRWDAPDGSRGVPGPIVDDLPPLPDAWVAELDRGPVSERSTKAHVDDAEVAAALSSYPDGPPCRWLLQVLSEARGELAGAVSRHDVGRKYVAVIVRAGEQGHEGSLEALKLLQEAWEAALASGESRAAERGEWERMVNGAVGIVTESPTPDSDRGCCGAPLSPGLDFDPGVAGDALEGFWTAREHLEHVRTFARARMCSPWSVLGVVMARMVTRIKPQVVLPPVIGSYASLNLFVALVGPSGMGKGASEAAAADAVSFGQQLEVATVGSGEGIGHLYAHREKGEVIRDRESVLFTVPEVDGLVALGNRQGATLLPQLRSAWSGEQLGFSYADPTKRLPIDRHSYRMGLILGVQPARARPLLEDADGGTPQRFVWLPTTDPQAPETPPRCPVEWKWPGIYEPWFTEGYSGLSVMTIPPVARETIVRTHYERLRGEGNPLDGHALLCRLKVAAALCLLDTRQDVSDEDWELAGMVMRVSEATRNRVREFLHRRLRRRTKFERRAGENGP